MLKRLRFKNFKAWRDTGEIRLAPITVFFGTNSSGKSSIQHLLLLLKQTVQSPDRQNPLHLGDSTTPIDFGTYRDIVFGHGDAVIEVELDWTLAQAMSLEDTRSNRSYRADRMSFRVEVGEGPDRRIEVKHLEYRFGERPKGFAVSLEPHKEEKGKFELRAAGFNPVRRKGRGWPLPPPVRFYGFPAEARSYFQNTGLLADLELEVERLFGAVHYVGPLREYPRRLYIWSGEVPEHVGIRGERAVEALLAARQRKINRGPNKRAEPFEALIARWLREMGLIDSFRVVAIGKDRKEYEVLLRILPNGPEVRVTDVGFGISQVLPVLVECFYVPWHSVVVFEQPEIHLHPAVQANLADLFIEAVRSREYGGDRRIQFIIESHSEHFLRRLQRRIAEGEVVKPDETALYFCTGHADGSRLMPLNVDLYGNVTNWPEGFFGDEMGELAAMADAALRRRSQAASG
jgi:predicted ATPase